MLVKGSIVHFHYVHDMDSRRNITSASPPHLIFFLDLSVECSGKIILVLNSLYFVLNVDTHWENWKNCGILFCGPHGEESLFLIASQNDFIFFSNHLVLT